VVGGGAPATPGSFRSPSKESANDKSREKVVAASLIGLMGASVALRPIFSKA
jgi:hypothetical protein